MYRNFVHKFVGVITISGTNAKLGTNVMLLLYLIYVCSCVQYMCNADLLVQNSGGGQ